MSKPTRYERIAAEVNRELQVRSGGVTGSLVERIDYDEDVNKSHPVHAAILAKLKPRKK